jgi:hypothetical protein
MQGLSALKVLDAWDRAQDLHAVDAALAILEIACADEPRDELASLSVGERDRRLLECRALTFGPEIELYAECIECGQRLEAVLDVRDLIRTSAVAVSQRLEIDGIEIRMRAPNSLDLADAVQHADGDPHLAARRIAERCISEARRGAETLEPEVLSDAVVRAVGERAAALDPMADIEILIACPQCSYGQAIALDIATLLREEIDAHARRLAREVHLLASAYGWSAETILAMSANRRALFLGMVQG